MQKKFTFELAGRTITVETGKYAEQAGGRHIVDQLAEALAAYVLRDIAPGKEHRHLDSFDFMAAQVKAVLSSI